MLKIIIPARSGSKGIKDKNIINIGGKPLLLYTLETAIKIRNFLKEESQIILTSDSQKILNIGSKLENINLIKRPIELSNDTALTVDVVIHSLEKTGYSKNDHILLLQPTVPYRPEKEIEDFCKFYDQFKEENFESIVSLLDVGGNHPFRFQRLLDDGRCIPYLDQGFEDMRPRQLLPKCYVRSGSYYLTKVKSLMQKKSLVNSPTKGYVHRGFEPINIDSKNELLLAEIQLSGLSE